MVYEEKEKTTAQAKLFENIEHSISFVQGEVHALRSLLKQLEK